MNHMLMDMEILIYEIHLVVETCVKSVNSYGKWILEYKTISNMRFLKQIDSEIGCLAYGMTFVKLA